MKSRTEPSRSTTRKDHNTRAIFREVLLQKVRGNSTTRSSLVRAPPLLRGKTTKLYPQEGKELFCMRDLIDR